MSTHPPDSRSPRVGDEQVAAIFQRAAELQAAAERAASPVRVDDEPTAAEGRAWTLAELSEVGREAGIAPEFVQQAVREAGTATPDGGAAAHPGDAGDLEWRRTVEASVRDAYTALRATAEASPWNLVTIDTVRIPGGGLRLSFDPNKGPVAVGGSLGPFAHGMYVAGYNFERIEIDIEPAHEGWSTLVARAVRREHRGTLAMFSGVTPTAAGGTGAAVGVLTSAFVLGLAGWAIAPLAAVGALAGAATGVRGLGAGVRYTVRKDAEGVQKLLGAAAARIHTQSFLPPRVDDGSGAPGRLPPP